MLQVFRVVFLLEVTAITLLMGVVDVYEMSGVRRYLCRCSTIPPALVSRLRLRATY